jgi:hypothetical protein
MRERLESDIRELQLKLHKAEVGKKYVWFRLKIYREERCKIIKSKTLEGKI